MGNQRIFISTSNFKTKFNNNLNDILKYGIEGYEFIEIASGHKTDENTLHIIREVINKGKTILLHNYPINEKYNLMINLCEEDEFMRSKIIEYIKEMILVTKEIGQNYYSIHGGFYPSKLDKKSKKKYNSIFIRSLKEIVEFAEDNDVYIGVENHVVEIQNTDKLYLYDKDDFLQLFTEIKSKYLKLHLDTGHLKVSANTQNFDADSFVKTFKDRIQAVHLHDNNGIVDGHNGFGASVFFLKYLRELSGLKNIIIESWDQDDADIKKMIGRIEDEFSK